jgi:hypothetical protein
MCKTQMILSLKSLKERLRASHKRVRQGHGWWISSPFVSQKANSWLDYSPHSPSLQVRYVPDWMPGATFKVKAAKWRDLHMQLLNTPFNMVREQMVSTTEFYMVDMLSPRYETQGKARPSFLKELLDDPEVCSDPEKLDIAKWGAASLYAGASDTVGNSRSCILPLIIT